MKNKLCALLVLVPALTALTVTATVVTNTVTKDNTLYDTGTTNTFLSDGAGETFTAGRTKDGFRRRGVIAFTGLSTNIPAGAVITSVTLRLYMEQSSDPTNLRPVKLYRLLADWGEGTSNVNGGEGKGTTPTPGDATWFHRFYNTNFWSAPGGDFLSTARATTMVPNANGYVTWASSDLVADVQAWLSSPATNFGWLVMGDESTNHTTRQFSSRQSKTDAHRPRLVVEYTSSDPVGACFLPNGSCGIMTSNQCFAAGGTWAGPNTTCPPPTGACCLTNGTCTNVTASECAALSGTYQGDNVPCSSNLCPIVLTPFVDPLPILSPLQPSNGVAGGQAYYQIRMQEFTQKLHRDLPLTRVWGYAGAYPGPLILASHNQPVTVKWINDLRDASGNLRTNHYLPVDTCLKGPDTAGAAARTVVHLHGGHVPPESDGYPEATILPGQQATNAYPNNQPAAMIWFHDHAMGITRLNVYMGLAGLYVIRDASEAALGLPSGPYEIPLVIQDRQFNPDGSLSYPASWMQDFFGDKILVNGKVWPYLNVKQGKYRFRLLNGSNARSYTLGLSSGASFQQVGTDDGLLSTPVTLNQVTLGPGERADTVMDFSAYAPGTAVFLTNGAPAPFPGSPGVGVISNVIKFAVIAGAGYTNSIPATLVSVPPIPTNSAALERTFVLQKTNDACTGERWQINGLGFDTLTEFPELGSTEIWDFINPSGMSHPMHMHLVSFQVLDRQPFVLSNNIVVPAGPPVAASANESGWKDTVQVMPYQIVRVIATFTDYLGRYPYHCHILEHEDQEMMRQFQVVAVAPSITGSPTNRAIIAGQSTTFTVTASGTAPLSYQWWFKDAPLPGATDESYTLTNTLVADAGNYYAVVTNVAGGATSAVATLTVYVPPYLVSQPQSQTVPLGTNVQFSVQAGGTAPLAYQWWRESSALAGRTADSLLLTNVSLADTGGYSVVVTNDYGSLTSVVATLTIVYEESTLAWASTNGLLVLRWIGPDWQLQSSPDLIHWTNNPAIPLQDGWTNILALPATNGSIFFRLLKL